MWCAHWERVGRGGAGGGWGKPRPVSGVDDIHQAIGLKTGVRGRKGTNHRRRGCRRHEYCTGGDSGDGRSGAPGQSNCASKVGWRAGRLNRNTSALLGMVWSADRTPHRDTNVIYIGMIYSCQHHGLTNVPHIELEAVVHHALDVEAYTTVGFSIVHLQMKLIPPHPPPYACVRLSASDSPQADRGMQNVAKKRNNSRNGEKAPCVGMV